ncbi:hypothetical protein PTD2_00616 [Pseudoalteromonas tunicata D2]|jgi:hypothetical protein|uniref:Uncharacterized protein n=1 Tax=Pseudoalteromonas tunicata D2 TaxID=87626 RepID=A4C394_9GAMM|nr:hypothetical protein PTD2_00616 [Pseudoalteromonas tunicata D2]
MTMPKHDAEELIDNTEKTLKYIGIALGTLLGIAIGYFGVQLFNTWF